MKSLKKMKKKKKKKKSGEREHPFLAPISETRSHSRSMARRRLIREHLLSKKKQYFNVNTSAFIVKRTTWNISMEILYWFCL